MLYSIGQVAGMVDVSSQSIRIWENKGLIPKPHRTATNHRRYTAEDVSVVKQFLSKKYLSR